MKYVPKAITRTVGRTVLKTKMNSPTILFGVGVVGVVSATVLACKATLEVEGVLMDHEKKMMEIGRAHRTAVATEDQRERQQVTLKTAGKLAKLYLPSVAVMSVSLFCLTKSHRIMSDRNTQLTAAYVGLQKFLDSYRGRVREKIGAEEEQNVYYASTPVELVQDTPNGPEKVFGSRPIGSSPYSCVFDETSKGIFQDSYVFNEHFVRIQADLLTNKLRAQGYLFLNDVYSRFDVAHTATGQVCGWFIDHAESDDYVDIKMMPLHDGRGSILLDFNVAGNVAHMLGDGAEKDSYFRKKLLRGRS